MSLLQACCVVDVMDNKCSSARKGWKYRLSNLGQVGNGGILSYSMIYHINKNEEQRVKGIYLWR